MKNIGFKSKNIIIILLLLLVGTSIDLAADTFFFTLPGITAMAVPFVSLEKTNICNMAGIATTLYVIDKNDIESFPSVGPPVTPADLVRYIDDFTLKPNKYWHTLYSTKEMGELIGEIDGPTDGKFFRITATAFYPRVTAEALGMTALFKNSDVIVILKEFSKGGQLRVVGTEDIPATIAGSENSGKAYSDEKGITYTIEAASCKPAMIYSGEIITETTILYEAERMAIDAVAIDASVSHRWVVGANTAPTVLTTITNLDEGERLRIEFDALSANSLAFTGEFAAAALIDADTEWFEITNTGTLIAPVYVITLGNFS